MTDNVREFIFLNLVLISSLLISMCLVRGLQKGKMQRILNFILYCITATCVLDVFWSMSLNRLSAQIVVVADCFFGSLSTFGLAWFILDLLQILEKRKVLKALLNVLFGLILLVELTNPVTCLLYVVDDTGAITNGELLWLYLLISSGFLSLILIVGSLTVMLREKTGNPALYRNARITLNTELLYLLFLLIEIALIPHGLYSTSAAQSMGFLYLYLQKNGDYIQESRMKEAALEVEFQAARQMQISLLPSVFPPFPERQEFEIAAEIHPYRAVGGDFYDFYLMDPDHLVLMIGDVSGDGVPAALFMAASKSTIKQCTRPGLSAGEILTMANNSICADNRDLAFVTVWLAILTISTGEINWANAGHEYSIVRRNGKPYVLLVEPEHNLALGIVPSRKYDSHRLQLHSGDVILEYTDGIPEAANNEGEQFQTGRMLRLLNTHPDTSGTECLTLMYETVNAFAADPSEHDDIAMLYLKYLGSPDK